jgi:hypothetical protein
MHIAPAAPQALTVRVVHVSFAPQHPASQLAALHTQFPFTHCCAAPHTPPLPHAHWPAPLHPSARNASHVPHVIPAGAHAITDLVSQAPPLQHPASQLIESHTHCPPEHR